MRYQDISDYEWGCISDQKSVKNARRFCEITGFDKDFYLVDGAWHTEFHWSERGIDFELRFYEDEWYKLFAYQNGGNIQVEIDDIPIDREIPQSTYNGIFDLLK